MYKRDATVAKALIPCWIATALKRNSLPMSAVFDLSKIKSFVSREDLAVIYCMNRDPSRFLGIREFGGWLRKQWAATDSVLLDELEKTLELYEGLNEPRLYASSNAATGGTQESDACTAFEIVRTDPVVGTNPSMVIVIRQGEFGEGRSELQEDLRRAFLKALYALLDVRQIAHDPVFPLFVADV